MPVCPCLARPLALAHTARGSGGCEWTAGGMPSVDADAGWGYARAIVSSYQEEGVMAGARRRKGAGEAERISVRGEGGGGRRGTPNELFWLALQLPATRRPASPLTSLPSPPRVFRLPPPSFARLPPEIPVRMKSFAHA